MLQSVFLFGLSHSERPAPYFNHCGGTQGDGIEVKQGSHHNWIYSNHVHDTRYPCILVYGTGGKGLNVIEQMSRTLTRSTRGGGESLE